MTTKEIPMEERLKDESDCNCADVEWDTDINGDGDSVWYDGECPKHGDVRQYGSFDNFWYKVDENGDHR